MNIRDDFVLKNINEGYLVGGMLRDYFSSEFFGTKFPTKDRDIAIKDAEKFAKKISEEFEGTFITLDEKNKIFRVVLPDKENYADICEICGNDINEDLTRRDFTINAIAYDLKNNEFIDITGGINDIKNKKLRHIKEENFKDDPLRILRAFRFMGTTGFDPDEELLKLLQKYLFLIDKPAKERIHDEIMKLFGGKYTSKTLLLMQDIGILGKIFPCVQEMAKIPANSHHHLDLIHHVIETVKQCEIQFENDTRITEHLSCNEFGGYARINHLKIACFLHDIGKYSCWTIENENGKERHRFIKHDITGAKIVIPVLKNLKFSNKQIEYISEMIKLHIYPSGVISAPNIDDKIMMRYIRKLGNNVIDNIVLAKSDRLSAKGPEVTKEMIENNINGLNRLMDFYISIKPSLKPLPKLINGNEIMEILGIKQSPLLGKIINEIKEAQINGDILTKDDAINFVNTYLK